MYFACKKSQKWRAKTDENSISETFKVSKRYHCSQVWSNVGLLWSYFKWKQKNFEVRGKFQGETIFSLCYFFNTEFFNDFRCLSLLIFETTLCLAWAPTQRIGSAKLFSQQMKSPRCCSMPKYQFWKRPLKIMALGKCSFNVPSTFNFSQLSCTFGHCFTGDRKVNCLLATRSNIFLLPKYLKTKAVLWLSYIQFSDKSQVTSSSPVLIFPGITSYEWAVHYLKAVICSSFERLSANEKEEKIASNDNTSSLTSVFGYAKASVRHTSPVN